MNNNKLIIILGIVALLWLGMATWLWHCSINDACGPADESAAELTTNREEPVARVDASQTPETDTSGQPQQNSSSTSSGGVFAQIPNVRLSGAIPPNTQQPDALAFGFFPNTASASFDVKAQEFFQEVATLLLRNRQHTLIIVGHFDNQETPSERFTDLGVARASFIASWLREQGVSARQLVTSSRQIEKPDSLYGVELRLREPQAQSPVKVAEPYYVNYNPTSDIFLLNDQGKQDLVEIVLFLRNNSDYHLDIIGHTDDSGGTENNLRLGLKRADLLAELLIEYGINPAQLKISSMGDLDPLVDNSSYSGRAKNRRVEMQVKR